MNSRIQFTLLASVVALVLSITPPTTTIRVQSAFATATEPANITTNNLHYLNNRTFKT
ncbi:MAG: hypothetical protein ACJ71F_03070 [Nitrososphaeraceae archaeon]